MMLFVWVLTTYPTYNEEVPATEVSLSTVPGTVPTVRNKQSSFVDLDSSKSGSEHLNHIKGSGFSWQQIKNIAVEKFKIFEIRITADQFN